MGGRTFHHVSNVLSEEKKQQVMALGRLGWSLRPIQQATHIRRETRPDILRPPASRSGRPVDGDGARLQNRP